IGAELFVMSATIVRAQRDLRRGSAGRTPVELADAFCRAARRRVEALFQGIVSNDDRQGYESARALLEGRYAWLEQGVIQAPVVGPDVTESASRSAAGH